MHVPSRSQAETYLAEAAELNPGSWIEHSRLAGFLAHAIASHHPKLDPEVAFSLGCLHDIGRRVGKTGARHIIDGFNFMMAEGYDYAARICITHSFPTKNIHGVLSPIDWNEQEHAFLVDFLNQIELNCYDKLIQLCDSVALPPAGSLIEKRLVDATLRYGIQTDAIDSTLKRWQAYLTLETEFSTAIGRSIYSLLPNIFDSTFGFSLADQKAS